MCRALTDRAGKRACSQLKQADTLCLGAAPVLVQGRHRLVRRFVGGGMPGGCGSVFSWRWLGVYVYTAVVSWRLHRCTADAAALLVGVGGPVIG